MAFTTLDAPRTISLPPIISHMSALQAQRFQSQLAPLSIEELRVLQGERALRQEVEARHLGRDGDAARHRPRALVAPVLCARIVAGVDAALGLALPDHARSLQVL